jgi:O-antigen ligase
MPSTFFFIIATLLLSLNLFRPFGLAISDWFYFGALGLGLIETFIVDRRNAPCWWRNRFIWVVALVLFGAIVSTMNSLNWRVAIFEIIQQIFVTTFFVSLAWIIVRRGKITSVLFAFILSGVFTAGIVLLDNFTGSKFGPTLSGTPDIQLWGRFAGTLGHPNKLGYFLVLTTLLSVGQLLTIKTSKTVLLSRLTWCVLIAIQGYGIYLSGSMTAYLGLLLGVVFIALSLRRDLFRITKAVRIAAVGIILSICLLLVTNFVLMHNLPIEDNNFVTQALVRIQSSTAESRLTTYAQAWDQIVRNPWFGVGYDQISTSSISTESRLLDYSVHNSLIQIWYTGGLFAFIGWLAIYIWVGWMALGVIRRWQRNILSPLMVGLASAALAILLMDQFQDAIYEREKWLVIGLLAGIVWEQVGIRQAIKAQRWYSQ